VGNKYNLENKFRKVEFMGHLEINSKLEPNLKRLIGDLDRKKM